MLLPVTRSKSPQQAFGYISDDGLCSRLLAVPTEFKVGEENTNICGLPSSVPTVRAVDESSLSNYCSCEPREPEAWWLVDLSVHLLSPHHNDTSR